MKNYSQEGNLYNGQLCQVSKRRPVYEIRADRLEILENCGYLVYPILN